MPTYQKRTQSGTDRDGNPTYTVSEASYKKKRKRRRKAKRSARRGTSVAANPLLMMGRTT